MISVLIERKIAIDMEANYETMAKKTLLQAYHAHGFIKGETFQDLNDPKHRFVLSKWRSASDWNHWLASEERKQQLNILNLLLSEPEKITLLENS